MENEEAIKVALKQIGDYDAWASAILDSLMVRKDLCKHPYPAWFDKDKHPEKVHCLLCGTNITNEEVHRSFNSFEKQEKVNKAIAMLRGLVEREQITH